MPRRAILITGSSKGLGKSLALTFARNGYHVILHGRDAKALDDLRENITSLHSESDVIIGDIRSVDTISKLTAIAELRDIEVLINNAGTYANAPLTDMSVDEFRAVVETNLVAPVLLIKSTYEIFRRKQSGLIMNINSIAGKAASPGESAYCASKHGLRGFLGSWRFEATADHVRVLDVYLGAMNTPMSATRKDVQNYIQPDDAAHFLFRLVVEYPSMRIDEVDLRRWIYKP